MHARLATLGRANRPASASIKAQAMPTSAKSMTSIAMRRKSPA
jgi:hypothetical protein